MLASIQHKYGSFDTVPHVGYAVDLQRKKQSNVLVDCHYLGNQNVMALRGDARKAEQVFLILQEGGHPICHRLVKQIYALVRVIIYNDSVEKVNWPIFVMGCKVIQKSIGSTFLNDLFI